MIAMLGKPVTLIHVPKCGGTSLGSALRLAYFYSQGTVNLRQSSAITDLLYDDADEPTRTYREYGVRDVITAEMTRRNVRCISGHVRFCRRTFDLTRSDRFYATILRDPVSRFVSHFNYVHRKYGGENVSDTLDAFLETDKAKRYGSHYLFYFTGVFQQESSNLSRDVARAIDNLNDIHLVGFTDRLSEFASQIERALTVKLVRWRRNVNTQPETPHNNLDDRQRSKIMAVCGPDIEIFNALRSSKMADK